MMEKLFEFLNDKWVDMPSPVKVVTYLTVLMSFVYLLFVPQFIDGKIVGIYSESGQEYAIQHEMFELDIDGRTIRFVTNGRGRFAIPKPSKFPLSKVNLTFFPEGTAVGAPEDPITLRLSDSLIGETKIYENEGGFSVTSPVSPLEISGLFETLTSFFFYSAHAQAVDVVPPAALGIETTDRQIRDILHKELGVGDIPKGSRLDDVKLSNRKLSAALTQIEKEQGIVINTDRNQINTVEDLVSLAMEQKAAEDWTVLMPSGWVKPASFWGQEYVLPISGSTLAIKPLKLLSESVKVVVVDSAVSRGKVVFSGNIVVGEHFQIENNGITYGIGLEKIEAVGFDRFFNPDAAFFSVKKK